MTDTCFVLAYVSFACGLLCAAVATKYAVKQNLRAVWDDLTGRRRQADLQARSHTAAQRRRRSPANGAKEPVVSTATEGDEHPGTSAQTQIATSSCEAATEVALRGEDTGFVLTGRLLVCHAGDAHTRGGEPW